MKELLRPVAAIALSALVLLGAAAALRPAAERNRKSQSSADCGERSFFQKRMHRYLARVMAT